MRGCARALRRALRSRAPGRAGRLHYTPVAVAGVVGTLASVGAFVLAAQSEWRAAELAFQRAAQDHLSVINTDLEEAASLIDTMRAVLESTNHPVDRLEFAALAGRLRGRTLGLRDLGWAPRVTAAERTSFERAVRDAGFPDFSIREFNAEHKLVVAGERPEYFPILYINTPNVTQPVMGLDVAFEPTRRSVIRRAVTTQRAAATAPISLVTTPRPRTGFMSFLPVMRGRPDSNGVVPAPDGLVFGAFVIRDMFEGILSAKRHLSGVSVYVFDPALPPGDRLIHWHPGGAAMGTPPREADLRERPHWEGRIAAVDRSWGALFVPVGDLDDALWSWHALAPPCVGLLMTLMVMAYLVSSIRRTAQLQALTVSLRQTTRDLHRQAAAVDHLARHDALTGLPNRRAFSDEINDMIARAARDGSRCALLGIDLDRFKPINDLHGHAVGDKVLRVIADRLRSVTRAGEHVARFGGDEFAAIVQCGQQGNELEALADRLIACLSEPMVIGESRLDVGASVGIAIYPQDGATATDLLHAADLAMYRAKRQGRGRWFYFERSLDIQARARSVLVADIRHAMAEGDIQPYFQPLMRLTHDTLAGFEILARWHHPERGVISPAAFIPVANDAGLLPELTLGLLRRACESARAWPTDLFIALNVSSRLLKSADFLDDLTGILARSGIAPQRLEIEVNEAALADDVVSAGIALRRMQRAGMSIALDDFGTSQSSLTLLQQIPFDKIKIDRTLVTSMTTHAASLRMVEAIAGLGRSFRISTSAEGVEDSEVLDKIRAFGIDFAQGYHFGRPVPADELVTLVLDRRY